MSKWLRAAEISKGMIIGLVVLVLAAGIFWGVQCRSSGSEKTQVQKEWSATKPFNITCSECGSLPDEYPPEQAKQMNKDKKDGMLKCPKCGKYTAKWGRGGSTQIDVEQGDKDKP